MRSTPPSREHRCLQRDLLGRAHGHTAADTRVLALAVLTDEQNVDLIGPPARQRRGNAIEQADRPQVHVLVEGLADRQQQPPQRHVVRHAGIADRAQVDGVEPAQRRQAILRHHDAAGQVVVAAPWKLRGLDAESEAGGRSAQDLQALGDDLTSDAIAGDYGQAICLHPMGYAARAGSGIVPDRIGGLGAALLR
jgi:hypothetical protein